MIILTTETIDYVTDLVLGKINFDSDPIKTNLILAYLNDKNSSTLREAITANICGYKWSSAKLGYDAIDESTGKNIEIKPKLFTDSNYRGNGNFSDLTPDKVKKISNDSVAIVCSLFAENKLCLIIEFSFLTIFNKIEEYVHKKCVIQGNDYARSASFSFKDYKHSDIKIHYVDFVLTKKYVTKELYKRLRDEDSTKLFK
jgi:hypothetical protein